MHSVHRTHNYKNSDRAPELREGKEIQQQNILQKINIDQLSQQELWMVPEKTFAVEYKELM